MNISLFQFALILSLAIHVVLLSALSLKRSKQLRKPAKEIEITYQKIKPKKVIQPEIKREPTKILREEPLAKPRRITPFKETKDKFTDLRQDIKDISKLSEKMPLEKALIPKIEAKDMARSIEVPLLKSEKITNPQYLSYNQTIRQKIREQAYRYVDHPKFETGEVYLTFIIKRTGQLEDVQVLDQRSQANEYLKEIGLRSVQEAAPFMPFPDNLPYPELTFNVVISFTLEK